MEGDTLQRRIHAEVVAGRRPDTLLFFEFSPTFTAGRATKPNDIPDHSLPVIPIDRGGSVTWHGPGQLVVYPIIRLREPIDVIRYVMSLERAVMATVNDLYGLQTSLVKGRSGVWVVEAGCQDKKLCALGVKQAYGVTMHGIALNVHPDTSDFGRIIPCGLPDAGVATLYSCGCIDETVRVNDLVEPLRERLEFYTEKCRASIDNPREWPGAAPQILPQPSERKS